MAHSAACMGKDCNRSYQGKGGVMKDGGQTFGDKAGWITDEGSVDY